jgi:RNA polymerase sporulation-specific sigma factor
MMIVSCCSTKGKARFGCAQGGCRECQEALLRENAGLVWVMVMRQLPGLAEYADLLQEGWIGLWQAIMGYDPERGYQFSTYACIAIRNQVWVAVRRSLKATGWQTVEASNEALGEIIQVWQSAQTHEALSEALEALSDNLREIVKQHEGWEGQEPQTFAQLGQVRGVSRQRVHQLYQKALALLRVPALSLRLRSLYSLDSRQDYREALRQNRAYHRKYRGRR